MGTGALHPLRLVLAMSFALVFSCAVPAFSYQLVYPESLSDIKQGFDYVYNEEYEKAEDIFQRYIKKYPNNPEGYFFMTGRYAEQINAYHDSSRMDDLHKWADITVRKAEAYNAQHPNDPVGYFYIGNTYGYLGLLEAQEQHLVQAFMLSVKAKKNLEKALEITPTLYDCHFGLGTLFYYASRKHGEEGGVVGWIVKKFITNDKDLRAEGIIMLRKAVSNGGITSDVAFSSLMWVLIAEGKIDEAYPMAQEMARRWPKDKHGQWAMGRILLLRGECGKASEHFEAVRQMVQWQNTPLEKFPEIGLATELTALCKNRNDWDKKKIDVAVYKLRQMLKQNPNIRIEYANSKGVVRDWSAMLERIDNQTFIESGDRHDTTH